MNNLIANESTETLNPLYLDALQSDEAMEDFVDFLGDLCDDVVFPTRWDDLKDDVTPVDNSFNAYWEGSVSQSVMNDYKAGKVRHIYAG